MTKRYFIELADYNIWANGIVHGWLNTLTDEQWTKPITSSFSSIAETSLHILSAENVWHQRLTSQPTEWLQSSFKGSKDELLELWRKASQNLKSDIENFDEARLMETFRFKRLNGDPSEMLYYQAFAHLFNHSTYHRGQLVTMLRQAGFTGTGSTDLLNFYRL